MYLILAFLMFISTISPTHAQNEETAAPVLRLSSPFGASLFQLDVTPDASLAVTSSSEGVVSLWNLATPGEPEILRTPLRNAERTRITGVAISLDGKRVALALPPLAGDGAKVRLGTGLIALFENKRRIAINSTSPDGLRIPTHAPKLKFSPDGAYLVAALGDGCGIRVWRTSDWSLFAFDDTHFAPPADFPRPYCGSEPKEVDADALRDFNNFDIVFQGPKSEPSSRVWFSISGKIGVHNFRMTESGIERVAFSPARSLGLVQPRGLALDAAGRRLAVGDSRRLQVAILDAATLAPVNQEPLSVPERYIVEAELNRKDTHLSQVAWVQTNGKEWLTAGGYIATRRLSAEGREAVLDPNAEHRFLFRDYLNNIVRWDPDRAETPPSLLAYGSETIMGLRWVAAGEKLLVMALNSIGDLPLGGGFSQASGARFIARKTSLDFRGGILAASPDGKSLLIKNYEGSEKILQVKFSLKDLYLTASDFDADQFIKPLQENKFLLPNLDQTILGDSENWTQRLTDAMPRFFFKDFEPGGALFDPANFDRTDFSRAAAVSSDRRFVLWGSANALRAVEDGGAYSRVVCSEPLRHEAMLVTFAADNTLAIVAQSDGAIRWYDIIRGDGTCRFALKLTLYAEISNELPIWTAFRPDGIFYSPHLDSDLAGWQSTDKFGQVTLDNLRKFTSGFLKSDVIQGTLDIATQIGIPNSSPETNLAAATEAVLAKKPDYDIEILNSETTSVNETAPLGVKFRVRFSENADPLMGLQMRVNGKPAVTIFQGRRIPLMEKMIIRTPGDYEATVALPFSAKEKQGALELTLVYGSEIRPLIERTISPPIKNFIWEGLTVEPKPRRIYALLVGLSDYNDQNYKDLRFAYQDAVFVAKVLMNDYEREVDQTGPGTRNFVHLHIDLILSPEDGENARLLLEDLEQQAERIKQKDPDGLAFTYRPTRNRPDNFAGDEAHDQIISAVGNLANLAGHDEQDFKDFVLLYLSGHGAARRVGDGADNFLITPNAPSYLSKPSLFPAKAVNLTEAVKPLLNTNAEVMIFLDACRTYINDQDLSAKIYDSLGRTLPHALLFIAAELGYETVALSFDQFPRRYPDPFKGLSIPPAHLGNSIFTHAFLLSLYCQDTALETHRGFLMDPMTIRSFIYRWYQPDTQDMATLLDKTKMTNIRQPRIRDESYLDTKYWFRQLDHDPEFKKCIKSAGF